MTKIIITENAKNDMADIVQYIALDNPVRAKSYVVELLTKSRDTISTFPLSSPLYNFKVFMLIFNQYKSLLSCAALARCLILLMVFVYSRVENFK